MTKSIKYSGTWRFYKKEEFFQGDLYVDREHRTISLDIILTAEDGRKRPGTPYRGRVPFINGKLFNGDSVLLSGCQFVRVFRDSGATWRARFSAGYAFWGLTVEDESEIKFREAFFEFGDIIEWTGLCSYHWEIGENNEYLAWDSSEPVEMVINDNLTITARPVNEWGGFENFETEMVVRQKVWFEFSYGIAVSFDTIMEDVRAIAYMIGIGISKRPAVRSAQYCHPSIYSVLKDRNGQDVKRLKRADLLIGGGNEESGEMVRRTGSFLYRFGDISSGERFEQWRTHYAKLRPILDLYMTAFEKGGGSDEPIFLNLVQALETFHARFITNKVKYYFERVDQLLEEFSKKHSEEECEEWRLFLIDKGQSRNKNGIFLRSRLADLTFAEGEVLFLRLGELALPDFIQKIIDTRNYYTHYDASKLVRSFSEEELFFVNAELLALLQFHVLRLLGFDRKMLRERVIKAVMLNNMMREADLEEAEEDDTDT